MTGFSLKLPSLELDTKCLRPYLALEEEEAVLTDLFQSLHRPHIHLPILAQEEAEALKTQEMPPHEVACLVVRLIKTATVAGLDFGRLRDESL